jgi:hypothetical protein
MRVEDVKMPDGRVVGRRIVSASFEEWIAHAFGTPAGGKSRWSDGAEPFWDAAASDTLELLAGTFNDCGAVLKPFTDEQVASGLDYVSNPSFSDIAFAFKNQSVPLSVRTNALGSLRKLYSDCFETRCEPLLSHLNEANGQPLNCVCYMWWDVFPVYAQPEDGSQKETQNECLEVMEFALQLKSDACRESALHGLGHWAYGYPERVQRVIDRFITLNPDARPDLLGYARRAREAGVL